MPGTYAVVPLLSRDGEIHLASMVVRGSGRAIAVDRFIDIWHQRTAGKRTQWVKVTVHGAAGDWSIFWLIEAFRRQRRWPKTWTCPPLFRPVNGYG
ncbi:MAG: hypothetical protein GXY83_04610 [Rhodopirellula sp.]|nr:hypothetical protein [Rhodopirellula sp.]